VKARKDYFQEFLDLSLTNLPEKKEVLGRLKSLERSRLGGVSLSNKRERYPRNGLVGRIKVEVFKSFQKYSKFEERFSSEGRFGPSDQGPDNKEQVKRRKYLNRLI
jgi:hypothetical protein